MKKFFISLIAGIALVSCSKNDDNKKENPQESNILRKMTTRDAEGNSSVALYTVENGRLTTITHQKYSKNGTPNGTPEVSTFYYDSHNRIIKAVTTGSEGELTTKPINTAMTIKETSLHTKKYLLIVTGLKSFTNTAIQANNSPKYFKKPT